MDEKKELNATELTHDEHQVLLAYRLLKDLGHGAIELAVKDGNLVKLWTTDKWDLEHEEKEPPLRG